MPLKFLTSTRSVTLSVNGSADVRAGRRVEVSAALLRTERHGSPRQQTGVPQPMDGGTGHARTDPRTSTAWWTPPISRWSSPPTAIDCTSQSGTATTAMNDDQLDQDHRHRTRPGPFEVSDLAGAERSVGEGNEPEAGVSHGRGRPSRWDLRSSANARSGRATVTASSREVRRGRGRGS
jgi:hypothetical protein